MKYRWMVKPLIKFLSQLPKSFYMGIFGFFFVKTVNTVGSKHPEWIDTYYSRGIYPFIGAKLNHISSLFDTSLTDLSFGFLFLGLLFLLIHGFRKNRQNGKSIFFSSVHFFFSLVGLSFILVACFQLIWGFNYKRLRAEEHFDLKKKLTKLERQEALEKMAEVTNHLREGLAEDGNGCVRFNLDYHDLNRKIGVLQNRLFLEKGWPQFPIGTIKNRNFSVFYKKMSNGGIYSPFTGEANIIAETYPPLLAGVVGHERAHFLGFAYESDASLLGYIPLFQALDEPLLRYSGFLSFWVRIYDLKTVTKLLSESAQRDIGCHRAFEKQFPRYEWRKWAWSLYDSFLKKQGVKGGIRNYSYGEELAIRYFASFGDKNYHLPMDTHSN